MDIIFNKVAFSVRTIESAVKEQADIFISEAHNKTDLKSLIKVSGDFELSIAIHWSHFSESADIALHYSELNNILFVGGGNVSAVVDLSSKQLIDINYPDLFWSWVIVNDHILELGELECRLYSPNGKLVGSAPVDPPYEYQVTNTEIIFSSIVIGKSSIGFELL